MAKKALPLLTGGLNELTRADLLDDAQLQICDNYEVIGDGTLKLRKDAEIYSESLNDKLDELFETVISMSEPYYPQKLLNAPDSYAQSDDYVLIFFGQADADELGTGNYELHMLYRYTDTDDVEQWSEYVTWDDDEPSQTLNDLLTDSGISLEEASDIKYTIGVDKIVITDDVNTTFFVSIDIDGDIRVGKLGIPAPTNKASVTQLTQWREDVWETDSTSSRLSDPGLFQCTYTVISKYGEESNPAPLSETLDMQFFKLDVDGVDERWIEKIEITALSVPSVSDTILETLKYFKVYMRVMRYSEGEDVRTLEFSEQVLISNKRDTDGEPVTSGDETGNNYTLTLEPEAGNVVSYENDVAPVAKESAELSGITMLGSVKTRISFPYDFKYFHKLSINNRDNIGYVDAVIKIRLFDEDATVEGGQGRSIENFTVSHFVTQSDGVRRREHIRLFDSDLTTPLICAYNGNEFDTEFNYLDLYVKIPLLKPAGVSDIYLCWTGDGEGGYSGVPTYYQQFKYGKIFDVEQDGMSAENYNETRTWGETRVDSGDILFANMRIAGDGLNSGNKANNNTGLQEEAISSNQWVYTPEFIDDEVTFNSDLPRLNLYQDSDDETRYLFQGGVALPDSGVFYYRFETFNNADQDEERVRIFKLRGENESDDVVYLDFYEVGENNELWTPELHWRGGGDPGGSASLTSIQIPKATHGLFIFSWEKGTITDKISVSIYYDDNGVFQFTSSYATQDDGEIFRSLDAGVESLSIGGITNSGDNLTNINQRITDIRFSSDAYFSGDNDSYKDKYRNIANYMPGFDNMIGYSYYSGTSNNNITYSETKEIEYKERKNMVKWSGINNINFPDLNFKQFREPVLAIIPAPSFLQFEYKNTFLIFTRNTINRFILEGTPDSWGGSVSSLIEEKTQYGLLSKDSLVKAGDAIFWLSEVGVIMWDSKGMRLISKNILNIPLNDTAIGFYNSLRNQYLIQSIPSPVIEPGGEEINGDDTAPVPGWIWDTEFIVSQSGHYYTVHDEVSAGLAFEIIGDSASVSYSNYILMDWNDIGYPHLSESLLGLMEEDNPLNEIWNYVEVFPDPEILEDVQEWMMCENYEDFLRLTGSGASQLIIVSNPYIEPGEAGYTFIRYNIPDVVFTIGMAHIQGFIDAIECANGEWFTSRGLIIEGDNYVTFDNPSGLLCGIHDFIISGINDIALLGFWFTHIEFLESAILQGRLRDEEFEGRDMGDVYSYHIDRNIWTKFKNINIKDSAILTGGTESDNINLLLNTSNIVKKYPGSKSVASGLIRTKKMYFEKGVLRRVNLEHSSDSNEPVIFRTKMEKYDSTGETIIKEHAINSVPSKKWKGIPLSKNRGRALTFEVENADNISTIGFDLRVEK